jgi:hypothetical protein
LEHIFYLAPTHATPALSHMIQIDLAMGKGRLSILDSDLELFQKSLVRNQQICFIFY